MVPNVAFFTVPCSPTAHSETRFAGVRPFRHSKNDHTSQPRKNVMNMSSSSSTWPTKRRLGLAIGAPVPV